MKISIVTPSFRNSEWLKLCIASVADQQGVELEHIVQDACSDDGTQEWLPHDPRVAAYIEKDEGMYDAVNRGWKRATGDIVAYINCDEQYLPGALKSVHDYFEAHPEVDVVVSDTVITDAQGNYVCHRFGVKPLPGMVWVRFSILTCALFIRRRALEEKALYFDTRWRDLGDAFWFIEAVRKGARFGELRGVTSVFADTGENMNLRPNAQLEREERRRLAPAWARALEPLFVWVQRWQLVRAGALRVPPFSYAIYRLGEAAHRVEMRAERPTAKWVGRSRLPDLV